MRRLMRRPCIATPAIGPNSLLRLRVRTLAAADSRASRLASALAGPLAPSFQGGTSKNKKVGSPFKVSFR
jgi:hypothetical protein